MSYKFKIENINNNYYFILYPNNSNLQMLGKSHPYKTKLDCLKGQKIFKDAVS